ncbi:MAG: hypothetical protein HQ498_13375 [Pseudohongiella sp.]|nr:hypothetical protein [Pseudohongiella sp.]
MPVNPQSNTGAPPPLLVSAIKKILRPLVKLMLSYQITYPYLIGILKSIYVDVAENEFQVDDKRPSDSRINLLTGVHRKDVKRLRAEGSQKFEIPENISIGAQLVGEWLGSKEFIDSKGKPKTLPLKPGAGKDISFDTLVRKVCKQDIRPRVILDEWLRLGIAHIENDEVVLNTGAFTPDKGFDEKAFFFGKNLQDHISAGSENLSGSRAPYFDRSVYYDNLSETSVQELEELANYLSMQALTEMNKEALSRQRGDKGQSQSKFRINFGVFNYSTEAVNENPEDEGSN